MTPDSLVDVGTIRQVRLRFWALIALFNWIGAGLVAAPLTLDARWAAVGLAPGHSLAVFGFVGLAVAVLLSVVVMRQPRAEPSPELSSSALTVDAILLPSARHDERLMWLGISATAGLCEELLYRALAITYLRMLVPLPLSVSISAGAFVYMHGGIRQTRVAASGRAGLAFVFSLVFLLTRLTPLLMVLHFAIDAMAALQSRQLEFRKASSDEATSE